MSNDYWRTPQQILDYVESRFGMIELDACAKDKKAAICKNFISEEMDALTVDWSQCVSQGSLIWCNPPYSNPLPWVDKAIDASFKGVSVCMILNMDTSTKWFKCISDYASIIMPIIEKRISFLNSEGQAVKGNSKPQMLVYFSHLSIGKQTEYIPINEIYGV